MSSSRSGARWRAVLVVLVAACPAGLAAQDGPGTPAVTAEEALENARDVYYAPGEERVSACPQDTIEGRAENEAGDTIVVCRQLGPANQFQTREGPRPRMDQTADGVPRAPDVRTIPPCIPGATTVCVKFGWVPPPALIVDTTKFPEPLSAQDAALVYRLDEPEDAAPAAPLTGERVPIPD